jgi:DNA-binding response OmpR family regulator
LPNIHAGCSYSLGRVRGYNHPMSELHLIVADPSLRAAVSEQLKLIPLENMQLHESDSLPASFFGDVTAIILDAPLADKKALGVLCGNTRRPKIFILGEAEADDQLATESFPKPLRLGHLLARLQFHLQGARMQGEPFRFGPFRLEPAARQIVIKDTEAVIRLTEKETHLLEYLGRSKKPVAREELLAAIWGYDARIDTHTLETHIYRLRRKLDPKGEGTNAIILEQGTFCLADVS